MTKRERAIIMAYTGGVTFKNDDIQYFLDYVKEKTGLELNVINWNFEGTPIIDFGSTENIDKIRKACKKDFDDLIRSSNEEESKEKDAERSAKKMITLEKRLGRDLRPDEAMLIALYESVNMTENDKKKEEKIEVNEHSPSRANSWEAENALISLALLGAILGIDPKSELKKLSKLETEVTLTSSPLSSDTIKDLFNHMDECCCDKCDHSEKRKKSSNNHEFSDAIAEAALEICGIDLKKVKND
jgi:hypothetical protein